MNRRYPAIAAGGEFFAVVEISYQYDGG